MKQGYIDTIHHHCVIINILQIFEWLLITPCHPGMAMFFKYTGFMACLIGNGRHWSPTDLLHTHTISHDAHQHLEDDFADKPWILQHIRVPLGSVQPPLSLSLRISATNAELLWLQSFLIQFSEVFYTPQGSYINPSSHRHFSRGPKAVYWALWWSFPCVW